MNKKTLSIVSVVIVLLSFIATPAFSAGQNENEKKEVELTILLTDDMLEGGAFHLMAEMYKEETGITVNVIEIPYADIQTKMGNMIRAGNAPNIVRSTNIDYFPDSMLDLSAVIDIKDIVEARRDSLMYNGKMIAIPSNITANGFLYNKTAFEQAGVKVPTGEEDLWTWDEFADIVEKVVENSDVEYGLVWDHSQHRYATLLYQFGGSIYNEDISTVRIANDKSLKSLEFFLSLFDRGIIPKSVWVGTEDASAMFKTGNVAVHMAGSWKISDYTENIKSFEWDSLLMPKQENRSSVLGGNFVQALAGTGLEQESLDFIKWFYSKDIYETYCETGLYLPGRIDANPEYNATGLSTFVKELASTPAIAGTDWGLTSNAYPGVSWGNGLRENIDLAITGDITAKEALENTEKLIIDTYIGIKAER